MERWGPKRLVRTVMMVFIVETEGKGADGTGVMCLGDHGPSKVTVGVDGTGDEVE